MTDDIVKRLRLVAKVASNPEWEPDDWMVGVRPAFLLEAADEIERLRALITEWVDAHKAVNPGQASADEYKALSRAVDFLYKEARRD